MPKRGRKEHVVWLQEVWQICHGIKLLLGCTLALCAGWDLTAPRQPHTSPAGSTREKRVGAWGAVVRKGGQ